MDKVRKEIFPSCQREEGGAEAHGGAQQPSGGRRQTRGQEQEQADHPINIPKKLEEAIESTCSAPALARTAHTCYAVLPEHYANALVSGPCITT